MDPRCRQACEGGGDEVYAEAVIVGNAVVEDVEGDGEGIELSHDADDGAAVAGVAEVEALGELEQVFGGELILDAGGITSEFRTWT